MTARFWNFSLLVVIVRTPAVGFGQSGRTADHNLNGWFMYFGDHPVRGRLGVHLEGRWRRHNLITRGQQLMLRPAIDYEITAGYAFIATRRYGGLPEAFPFSIYTPRRLMKLGKFRFPWAMATTSTNQFIAR